MKEIQLTQGQVALIDDDDFESVSKHKWYAKKNNVKCKIVYYACTNITLNGKRNTIRMHQFILGKAPNGKEIDHANGITLDNQRDNIRFCTRQQNRYNSMGSPYSVTKCKGVTYNEKSKMYRVRVNRDGKRVHVGCFAILEEAVAMYDIYALRYQGEFAYLNDR